MRPTIAVLVGIMTARNSFVNDMVAQLEGTHPELVSQMLQFTAQIMPIEPDGNIKFPAIPATSSLRQAPNRREFYWSPRPMALTQTVEDDVLCSPSAAAFCISLLDKVGVMKAAACRELPQAILELVASDPNGAVGQCYRRYIEHVLLSQAWTVVTNLKAHGSTLEWPTKVWLQERCVSSQSAQNNNSNNHDRVCSRAHTSSTAPPKYGAPC
eukprot:SAG31_NODE_100_length_25264_cov_38.715359_20_plen_212_part_00